LRLHKSRYYEAYPWRGQNQEDIKRQRDIFRRWVREWGTAFDYHGGCLGPLFGARAHGDWPTHCDFAFAGRELMDHGTLFKRDGMVTAIVGQPYPSGQVAAEGEDFSDEIDLERMIGQISGRDDVIGECARRSVRISVSAGAWHARGAILVVFTREVQTIPVEGKIQP